MIKKIFNFINSALLNKIICLSCYTGILGVMIFTIMKIIGNEKDEELIYLHSKNASLIFLILIFSIPVAKMINKFYFYLLDPQLNILLGIVYAFCIYKFFIGLKSIFYNELPSKTI